MQAIVLGDQGVTLETGRREPVPASGEVLVRVLCAGICDTDLQLVRGYKGFRGVLGHEFVGVPLSGPHAGRRVVADINCSCHACETCLSGSPGHCPHRTVVGILGHDGAFADLVAIPERNLHLVPESLDTEAAVFTEPVAAAFEIPTQLKLRREDRIVVLGDGRLGNLCAQVLSGISDHVLVVGKHAGKLHVLNALGIETRVLADRPTDRSADIVVDCTGSEAGLPIALELVRPRGTVVLKTTLAGAQTLACAAIVVDEVTVVGSRCGPFEPALDALVGGLIEVEPLVSDRFNLSDGLRALERAAEPGVLKVILEVSA